MAAHEFGEVPRLGAMAPTTPPNGSGALRLAVDATSLLDPLTGVGVFTREILRGLQGREEDELVAFAVSLRGRHRLHAAVPPGVQVGGHPVSARGARRGWLHSGRPTARSILGRPVDVVHGPNFVVPPGGKGVAEVVTIHDLTAVHHPELCTPDVLQWPPLLERSLRRGAWIHTVSEFVRDEMRERYPDAADRIVAVPNGVTPPPAVTPASSAAVGHRLAGGARYVLSLGTVEPRKDLPALVAAFDVLAARDNDLRLVIAGPDGWGAEALTAARAVAHHSRRIVRLGWVDDQQRLGLLRGASVVAYPSRYEGFGLVPLEALAVGTPVVATAVGALPEVLDGAAPLVELGDQEGLVGALDRVLNDEGHRAEILERGAARVARYRWSDTVTGLIDLYRRADAARTG
jgi:glycosyltransferase involved in cell wall biosynthesis